MSQLYKYMSRQQAFQIIEYARHELSMPLICSVDVLTFPASVTTDSQKK